MTTVSPTPANTDAPSGQPTIVVRGVSEWFGSVVAVTKSLGSEGLVGLVAAWVLLSIFNKGD